MARRSATSIRAQARAPSRRWHTADSMPPRAPIAATSSSQRRATRSGFGLPVLPHSSRLRHPIPGFTIVDLVLNPSDFRSGYAVARDSNKTTPDKVYHFILNPTTPAMSSVVDVTNNLKDNDLRTVEMVQGTTGVGDIVLAGGLLGVSRLIQDPSSKNIWTELGQGLANAPVTDLHYYTGSNLLLAGTFGRGAWTANETRDDLGKHSILRIEGTGDRDVVEISRVADRPWLVSVQVVGGAAASIPAVHARADRVRWEGRRRSAHRQVRKRTGQRGERHPFHRRRRQRHAPAGRPVQHPADRQATRRARTAAGLSPR